MTANGDSVTWRWLVGVLGAVVFALCAAWAADMTATTRETARAIAAVQADVRLLTTGQADVVRRLAAIEGRSEP